MRLTSTIAAITLASLPTLSFAAGCNWGHSERPTSTAMTCAEGQVYDAATGTCVAVTTS